MKHYRLKTSPLQPVSHDPSLKKRVLMDERHLCVTHISHIILEPGTRASEHVHTSASEVFYCIRGAAIFSVMGGPVKVEGGDCIIVEAGEKHSIDKVIEETELLYFHALAG